jgi:D-alanyl-D-alanine carboxypeptidase
MMNLRLQSLAFGILMLLLVSIGRSTGNDALSEAAPDAVAATSLIADVRSALEERLAPRAKTPLIPVQVSSLPASSSSRLLSLAAPETHGGIASAPKLSVQAASVSDLDRDTILYEIGSGKRWPIASLTKLMTALLVAETFPFDEIVSITDHAVSTEGVSGGFIAGEQFTVTDLLSAMLVASSNDAAVALADRYGYEEFVRAMRSRAVELGMRDTNFADPAGLSPVNQSTIRDLATLIHYLAASHPKILAAAREGKVQITETSTGKTRELSGTNEFANRSGFVGGKTGFTDEARGNLISLFSHDGNRLLVIVLGTEHRFSATDALYKWALTLGY